MDSPKRLITWKQNPKLKMGTKYRFNMQSWSWLCHPCNYYAFAAKK